MADGVALVAGCGSRALDPRPGAWVVGLDVSPELLAANPSLDERICADLQTFPLQPNQFDTIICQDVLEHLDRPLDAVDNMLAALKPTGELHLGYPHPLTPKGLVTKMTPHRFHIWVYRRLLGKSDAGLPGHAPFPVVMRWSLRPRQLCRYLVARGCSCTITMNPSPPIERLWARHAILAAVHDMWPFGNARLTECVVVARKLGPASHGTEDEP